MSVVLTLLREIRDPRAANARHSLADILFVALAAMLCGCKTCVEFAEFAEARLDELRGIVPLRHGAPSHDTFSRVFRLLDPAEVERLLSGFITELRRELGLPGSAGVVAVDGKALRRAYEAAQAHLPPLMVGLWDDQTRLALASRRAPGGDEVAATLDLLRGLTLKGGTVTADALHCHPAMAEAVLEAGADYVLTIKANHRPLFAAAEAGFAAAPNPPAWETHDHAHSRKEWRRTSVLPLAALDHPPAFPGLKAIGRIEASRTDSRGRTRTSVRYFALSRPLAPYRLAATVRGHWGIENRLHWSLDVVFNEDNARSRKNYAPQNLAVIRRLALNILSAHPAQQSNASKMRKANWHISFLIELFTHMR